MEDVLLVNAAGRLGGTVTFAEDVTLLAGLTADSNVLDSCDFSRVSLDWRLLHVEWMREMVVDLESVWMKEWLLG